MSSAPNAFVPLIERTREEGESLYFVFQKRKLVLVEQSVLTSHPSAHGLSPLREHYLGTIDETHVYCAEIPEGDLPETLSASELFTLYGRISERDHALAGRAVQIVDWDRTHRFCGACGAETVHAQKTRSRICPACKLEVFPRLSPAIIVAIERGDEILMARGPQFPKGIYSVLAGFVDPGESIEDAVAREVYEEVGLRIRNVRYFASQPWPYPCSLMLGFQADYESGEIVPQEGEIEDAAFYRFDALPKMFPGKISISQWLIEDFVKRRSAG